MNRKGMGFGIFLIAIGIIWLLITLNIAGLNLVIAVEDLWPLVFVVLGVVVIFKDKPFIKAGAWVALLVIVIVYGLFFVKADKYTDNYKRIERNLSSEYQQGTQKGVLSVKTGALTIRTGSVSDKLTDGVLSAKESIRYQMTGNVVENEGIYELSIADENTVMRLSDLFRTNFNSLNNRLDLKLNNKIPWDVDIDTGAVDGKLDFTDIALNEFDLDMGAGNITLNFGKKCSESDVDINCGATKINLVAPLETGVKVTLKGAVKTTNLDELGWERDGETFTSPNYSQSDKHINIDVSMGAGSLDISLE